MIVTIILACLVALLAGLSVFLLGRLQAVQHRQAVAEVQFQQDLLAAQAEKADLVGAYSRFVPTQFLKHLQRQSISEIKLGDQVARTMTVLFSDIRNFTTLSEKLSPQENFTLLNGLLSRMGPVIRQHSGFIDKYIGDAIMALFDGPVDDALAAAVDLQLAIRDYNQPRLALHQLPISIGIGLHRGPLMLGIIGEEGRMDSTVIADAVNLASRIESLTKHYDCQILVSRSTFEAQTNPESYATRPVDLVAVKGKSLKVELLEILDERLDARVPLKIELAAHLAGAIAAFRAGDLLEARSRFQNLAYRDPQDHLYLTYRHRIDDLLQRGLPESWDGCTTLDSK